MIRSRSRGGWFAAVTVLAALAAAPAAGQDGPGPHDEAEFDALFEEVKNWGRWGADDELGTANLITEEKRRQALALATRGRTVSLSHNPMPGVHPDNPDSAFNHTMAETLRSDTIEFSYHGYGVSHIDALCHFLHKGMMYNGLPADTSSAEEGCVKLGIDNLKDGIVTRGVLLDIPRLKGVDYLEPGTPIYTEDIEAWLEQAGVTMQPGDAVFLQDGPLGASRRRGAVAALGQLGRHPRLGHPLDPRRGRGPVGQRRGDRRAAVTGRGRRAAAAHVADRGPGDQHLRQHGPRGSRRRGGGGGALGVPDRGRADPGDRRHRLAAERDRGVLGARVGIRVRPEAAGRGMSSRSNAASPCAGGRPKELEHPFDGRQEPAGQTELGSRGGRCER